MDMGIQLYDKTGEDRDNINEMIDDINATIEKYGFRVRKWSPWNKFLLSCVGEYEILEKYKER